MSRYLVLAVAAVVLAGCGGGDPREPFLGVFDGTNSFSVNWSDGTTEQDSFADRIYIAPAKDTSRIIVGELCDLTATFKNATEFEVELKQCPAFSSGSCNVAELVQAGTGKIDGDALTLSYTSTVNATCPTETVTGNVTSNITATRQ